MTMQDARRTLGERIIEAARLAMLAHLECSNTAEHDSQGRDSRQRQTPAADGVGIATPTDGNVRDVRAFPTDGEPVLPTGLSYLAAHAHPDGRAG